MFKKMILGLLVLILVVLVGGYWIINREIMGRLPTGERKLRVEKSPNYKDGEFKNTHQTEVMSENATTYKMLKELLTRPETSPEKTLPSIKTDLKSLQSDKPTIVWFGHSSYFIKINGLNILVDPVFSGSASPFSFLIKNYAGSNVYQTEDFPTLDAVIITHDHFDHLDYYTIKKLISKTKKFYTALGVGEHLEYWGIANENIIEFDWWESIKIADSVELTATPARHFSGRSLKRAQAFWASFVLKSKDYSLYLGGDSGYDTHYKEIGEKFGPFDLAFLECGQYGQFWSYIHMKPEDVAKAASDLKAKYLLPIHWSKFTLSVHTWTEPITRLEKAIALENTAKLVTPKIGEVVVLDSILPSKRWWLE